MSHKLEVDAAPERPPPNSPGKLAGMSRSTMRAIALALIFFLVGLGVGAAVFAYVPDPGSPPSIFDDFQWSSTANGFWHVNAVGASAHIKDGILTLSGDSIELDHRVQTDPITTVVSVRVRGLAFHKFGLGIGVFHAGTVGMEFDDDGVKCGRASEYGWKVDFLKAWSRPPVGQWYYLEIAVSNPYPNPKTDTSKIPPDKIKPVKIVCSMWDDAGNLVSRVHAVNPKPNSNYGSFDEAFVRTWDPGNKYQVDWFYAGPPSGDPIRTVTRG
jgi:hypothetical protein